MTSANTGTRIVAKAILPVADMTEASAFYKTLGFEVERYDAGYAWVTNHGVEVLHLAGVPELDRGANCAACYLHVQDVDAWHDAWSLAGVETGPVADRPWQMREFELRDPDGNLLRIGQNI